LAANNWNNNHIGVVTGGGVVSEEEEVIRSNMRIGSTTGDSELAYKSYCTTATTGFSNLSERQE